MKKFFSRFSHVNGPAASTIEGGQSFGGEKPHQQSLNGGNFTESRSRNLIESDKVKSLAAKYEAAIAATPSSALPDSSNTASNDRPLPPRRAMSAAAKEDRNGQISRTKVQAEEMGTTIRKSRQSEPPSTEVGKASASTSPPSPPEPKDPSAVSPIDDMRPSPSRVGSQDLPETTIPSGDRLATTSTSTPSAALSPPSGATGLQPSSRTHSKDQGEASTHSANSGEASSTGNGNTNTNGHSSAAAPIKSVAFAPSPKKPSQAMRSASPPPALPTSSRSLFSSSTSSTNSPEEAVSNFAKPTVASSARARSQHQPQRTLSSSDSVIQSQTSQSGDRIVSTSSTIGSTSKSSSSASHRLSRTHSTGTSSRRGSSSNQSDSIFPTISHPVSHHTAGGSSVSLSHGAGDIYAHLPNSIPFASVHGSNLRSASPLSFATASSFAPAYSRRSSLGVNKEGMDDGTVSAGWASTGARSFGGPSWTEMTEEDLVMHLGPRERTRQEVLWEIVASEERYVAELEKTKELYLDPLLHPLRFSPPQSPHINGAATLPVDLASQGRSKLSVSSNQNNSNAELPIAARFSTHSPQASQPLTKARSQDEGAPAHAAAQAEALPEFGGRSPYAMGNGLTVASGIKRANNPSSSPSLRPSPAPNGIPTSASRKESVSSTNPLKAWSKRTRSTSDNRASPMRADAFSLDVPLPLPLKAVLEALSQGLTEGHALLSEALRARYEEQWPLVRSLADVFLKYSYILQHYAAYVCHLERALDILEEAALMERAMKGKRIKKERLSQTVGLGRAVAALEAVAIERGESGLSIFLSKPFQRLLKYPLLFQNLLFHTDPSTYEFESTVAMVVEVERIVRSIEDEKISTEERDKTRDAFARIEGIADKQLLKPRQDRILIEERALYDESPRRALSESTPKNPDERPSSAGELPRGVSAGHFQSGSTSASASETHSGRKSDSNTLRAAIKSKRSYRRLSDFLSSEDKSTSKAPNMGSKHDIWILKFSDVELKCQRVGVTALPMASSAALRPIAFNPDGTIVPSSATASALNDETEIPAADLLKRSKESKDRLKALRSTTLRAKTRNLYKFLGVVSWRASKQQQQQPPNFNPTQADGTLAVSHEVDEEDEIEEEDEDESSDEGEDGVLNSEKYIRQSKLSFSYWGADKVEPRVSTPQLAASSTPVHASSVAAFRANAARTPSSSAATNSASPSNPRSPDLPNVGLAKRQSSQPGAQGVVSSSHAKPRVDKFGARLRSSEVGTSSPSSASTNAPLPKRANSRSSVGHHSTSAVDLRETGGTSSATNLNRPLTSSKTANRTVSSTTQPQAHSNSSSTSVRSPLPHITSADSGLASLAPFIDASLPSTPTASTLQERPAWR